VRLCYSRYDGKYLVGVVSLFTIDEHIINITPNRLVKSRETLGTIPWSIEEECIGYRAGGKIIPDEADVHKGKFIFEYPSKKEVIIEILIELFRSTAVYEWAHDNCGFGTHYLKYRIFIDEEEIGTLEEILKPYFPDGFFWN